LKAPAKEGMSHIEVLLET
ncbi:unnamed protein product, partial [Fusarium fujikuroi]